MKKILTLSIIFSLLITGVCFAEKSKLKKKTWTPVQTRVENSLEVQDFYNHKEVYHEGDKQSVCGLSRLFPIRKAWHIPIFMRQ